MRSSNRRRIATGALAAIVGGTMLVLPAPAANDRFEILVSASRLADGTELGVGGDGSVVLFSSVYSNSTAEDLPDPEDFEDRPFLAPNQDLFRWRPRVDVVDQFTATANVENAEGDGYLFETYNDQPAVVSRTARVFAPLEPVPSEVTAWAAAYRSNADQTQGGASVPIDDIDPRMAGGGAGHIFVRDSESEDPVNVFANFVFGGPVSLDSPSVAMVERIIIGKVSGQNDDQVIGIEIDDVYVAFSGTVNFEADNDDGSEEIFLWTRSVAQRVVDGVGGGGVSNGGTVQITHETEGRSWAPAVNRKGEVLFLSTSNITGDNPDGHTQLFRWSARQGFRQVTNLTGQDIGPPSWSADGRVAVFSSTGNPGRRNPDESQEIFTLKGRRIRQVTSATTGASTSPSISADGREIAFLTDANLRGMVYPSESPEIAVMSRGGKRLSQITLTGDDGVNEAPTITRAGNTSSVIFVSTSNFTGRNSNQNRRIYIAPVQR